MKDVDAASDAVMNLQEAARFVRVSEKTLAEMAREGRIPSQKVGREWRFLITAIRAWLAGGGWQAAPASSSKQGLLFDDIWTDSPSAVKEKAGFRDTAFTRNRAEPLHRWVPWVAGFSAPFVAQILDTYCVGKPGSFTVLDPFCGVGTTLVEACKKGCNAIGYEINPYAALATQTKLTAAAGDVDRLYESIDGFHDFMEAPVANRRTSPRSKPPPGFRSKKAFFPPKIERQVLFVQDFTADLKDAWTRDAFRVALGAVMVGFSNYSYEPSLSTRTAAGKPDLDDADVAGITGAKIAQIAEDTDWLQRHLAQLGRAPHGEVRTNSFLTEADLVREASVDLIVTSPPYLNNYHYVRNTRPHLFWLGFVEHPAALRELEQSSFGQFWQTVRSGPNVALDMDYRELKRVVERVRAANGQGKTYGGRGWANYAATYFNDCARFCEASGRLMKRGGTAIVVIGNSILQGIEMKTDEFFAGIAKRHGFRLRGLHRVRKKRTGSSIVNSSVRVGQTRKPTELYETAVELQFMG